MEAIRSSETSVDKISTRRHMPEDGILSSLYFVSWFVYTRFENDITLNDSIRNCEVLMQVLSQCSLERLEENHENFKMVVAMVIKNTRMRSMQRRARM
jgi:hypothetical protein